MLTAAVLTAAVLTAAVLVAHRALRRTALWSHRHSAMFTELSRPSCVQCHRHPLGHRIYAPAVPPAPAAEMDDGNSPPPLSLTILSDGTHLELSENERFWCRTQRGGALAAVASAAPQVGVRSPRPCHADAASPRPDAAPATPSGLGLTGPGVYAVGAVPAGKRCPAVGPSASTIPPAR